MFEAAQISRARMSLLPRRNQTVSRASFKLHGIKIGYEQDEGDIPSLNNVRGFGPCSNGTEWLESLA